MARGAVEVAFLEHATYAALQDKVRKNFHVLHYIGHGTFEAGEGRLLLEDEEGKSHPVGAEVLANLLRGRTLRLVVLNACETAVSSEQDPFLGLAPALIKASIPAVVAMQTAMMPDKSAIVFAREFYQALADYEPLEACMTEARLAIQGAVGADLPDWAIPVLFLRAEDGRLFSRGNEAPEIPAILMCWWLAVRNLTDEPERLEQVMQMLGPEAPPMLYRIWNFRREQIKNFQVRDRAELPPLRLSFNGLPKPASIFVDRECKLQSVKSALQERWLIGISGIDGVGKTELVIRAIADLRSESSDLFDGLIWVDADAKSPQLVLDCMVAQVSSDLGIVDQMTPGKKLDLLAQAISGHKMALVFDNVRLPERISSLIELVGIREGVIISRSPMEVSRMSYASIKLEKLPDQAAVELFEKACGLALSTAQRVWISEICTYLGNVPYSILLVAKDVTDQAALKRKYQQVKRQALPLVDMEKLSVQLGFDVTYQDLSDELQYLVLCLSVFADAPADRRAVAAVGGVSDAREALQKLVGSGFVIEEQAGRYALHPAVKVCARKRMGDNRSFEHTIIKRFCNHFIERALASKNDYWTLAADVDHIRNSIQWCETTEMRLRDAASASHMLGNFYYSRGEYSEARNAYEKSIKLLEMTGDDVDLREFAKTIHNIAVILSKQGKYEMARQELQTAAEIFASLEYARGLAAVEMARGNLELQTDDYQSALDQFARARDDYEIAIEHGQAERDVLMKVLNNMGLCVMHLGKLDEAQGLFEKTMRFYEDEGNQWGLMRSHSKLAQCFLWQELLDKAQFHIAESLRLTQELKTKEDLSYKYRLRAELAIKREDYEAAVKDAQRAIDAARDAKDPVDEGIANRVLGVALREKQDFSGSRDHLREAIRILKPLDSKFDLALSRYERAHLFQVIDASESAIAEAKRALAIFSEIGAALHIERAAELLESLKGSAQKRGK